MDEYTSEIMMGGRNTLVIHNTCEDSLLASPLILDLVILAELCQRINFKVDGGSYQGFNSVLSILSYLCKAPLVPKGTPVVNALFTQRACIQNILRACIGLPAVNYMSLEHKHEVITSSSNDLSNSAVATNGVKNCDIVSKKIAEKAKIGQKQENASVVVTAGSDSDPEK